MHGDSNKMKWWFILRGDENTLKMLESDWERIQIQTNWKLEQCTAPSNHCPTTTTNYDLRVAMALKKLIFNNQQ